MLVRWPIPTVSLCVLLLSAFWAPSLWAQRAIPRTSWDQQESSDPRPELPSRTPSSENQEDSQISERLANAKESLGDVPADLQSLFDTAQQARSVLEYNSVIERCKNVAGDTTRLVSERSYAKKLLSWAANRRGELRSDMAGEMVVARQLAEAENLDRAAMDDFRLAIQNDPLRWRAHHNLGCSWPSPAISPMPSVPLARRLN
ncbi:MAG: hypothetical protein ACKOOI_13395 [Pirellula sp.]